MTMTREEHMADQGEWPEDFPVNEKGRVEEGLVVWSRSHTIEGRTTGPRRRCASFGCPGWFIGVNWESETAPWYPCSKGWHYDAETKTIRITGGGEISARINSPNTVDIPPSEREAWPSRESLTKRAGWKVNPPDA